MKVVDACAMNADVCAGIGLSVIVARGGGKDGELGAEHPAPGTRKIRAPGGDDRDSKEASAAHACSAERYGSGVRA